MRFILILLFCVSLQVAAKEMYGPYQADVVRVIDGDTVKLVVHVYQISHKYRRIPIF